jgi:DNA-binding beta-propeller fold protein YncE
MSAARVQPQSRGSALKPPLSRRTGFEPVSPGCRAKSQFPHRAFRISDFGFRISVFSAALAFALPAFGKGAASSTNRLVWPPPPAEARVAYVQSIGSPADFGVKPGALSRVANWISGDKSGSEPFVRPFGVALDAAGNLLVTDTGANTVGCYDRARKKWLRWDQAGKTRFESPVAVARIGNTVLVADSGLGKVLAFDEKGKAQFEITRELTRPSGLAVLGDRIYIADTQRHHVVICDQRGGFVSKFGKRGAAPGEFNFPTHLAAGPGNRVLVTDSMNARIEIFDADGQFQRVIGGPGDGPGHFSRPKGVAVDSAGHIYVVDALFDNVQIFDDQGRLLLNVGEAGSDPGQFWLANGIAISRDNDIYVADSYNHRVQVFKYVGQP